MSISELSRTTVFRLTLFYSIFFSVCVIMLLGFVYWQTATEMTNRVDQILQIEKTRFTELRQDQLPEEIYRSILRDQRHIYFYGLFTSDGHLIYGNVPVLPQGIPVNSSIFEIRRFKTDMQVNPLPVRLLIVRLDSKNSLLIGHDVQQLIEFGEIMKRAFFWGGSLTILLGLIFGLCLSFRPLWRVEQIKQVCELIMRGNIKHRLAVSRQHNELDMLATIVNRMLDEVERLMLEVKSVGDHIAHDLRTPLTRLRALIYRLHQQLGDTPQGSMTEQLLFEVDSLLLRFRAMLRISDIESKQRRVGFRLIQLQDTLEQAVNFIEPLAEEKLITLSIMAEQVDLIYGDSELLFEAIVNLLDNAIKFTYIGGRIEVRLSFTTNGAKIDIVDSGTGINESERIAVLNRFYRANNDLQVPGFGLGLSIVMAIIRLHDFRFELGDANPGTCATIYCWPHNI